MPRKKKSRSKKPKDVFEYRVVEFDDNGVMSSKVCKMRWNVETETWETVE